MKNFFAGFEKEAAKAVDVGRVLKLPNYLSQKSKYLEAIKRKQAKSLSKKG